MNTMQKDKGEVKMDGVGHHNADSVVRVVPQLVFHHPGLFFKMLPLGLRCTSAIGRNRFLNCFRIRHAKEDTNEAQRCVSLSNVHTVTDRDQLVQNVINSEWRPPFQCAKRRILYLLCRYLQPERVVETGVWLGYSSAMILQALEDNGIGLLTSIDLPGATYIADGTHVDESLCLGATTGMVVPQELWHRWQLILRDSREVLPGVLKENRQIDIFIHDSEHSYETMIFEYRTAWPHIKQGGLLISDDIDWNTAFLDFSKEISVNAITTGGMGFLVKG